MKTFRKTYIEFSLLGKLIRGHKLIQVESREISKIEIPKTAFGYRFFDVVCNVNEDGTFNSDRLNFTPFHYFGGTVYTITRAKKEFPKDQIFLDKMEIYGTKKLIRFKTGLWQIFETHDLIIKRPRTKRVSKAPRKKL